MHARQQRIEALTQGTSFGVGSNRCHQEDLHVRHCWPEVLMVDRAEPAGAAASVANSFSQE